MQTTIFEIVFIDGSKYRIFCKGRNQIKRFLIMKDKLKDRILKCEEILNAIHDIKDFETIFK